MKSPRSYPARRLRALRVAWVRRNRWLVVGITAVTLVMLASVPLPIAFIDRAPWMWWAVGVVQGGLVALGLHSVNMLVLANESSAVHHLRGAWGEDNTRSELARARKRGVVWGWVDSLEVDGGDIDHVVITRDGGVVALDSKWRSQISSKDSTTEMAASARRAAQRAEALTRSVLSADRGRRRARGHSLRVRPVVVVWGAASRSVPEGASVDGVVFLKGRKLGEWLRELTGEQVDAEAAKDLAARLEQYRTERMSRLQAR